MAATALLSAETRYQAKFRVRSGNAHDLFTTLFRGRISKEPRPIQVIHEEDVSNEMGGHDSIGTLNLLLTGVSDKKVWDDPRAEWGLRGFVLDQRFEKRLPGKGPPVHAAFELECSTIFGGGTLRILAHEQPPPLIELIEWCQMIERVRKMLHKLVIEVRHDGEGRMFRGIINRVEFFNDRFEIGTNGLYVPSSVADTRIQPSWTQVEGSNIRCMIPQDPDAIKPLVYRDGRITFSTENDFGRDKTRLTYTFFPQTNITWSN